MSEDELNKKFFLNQYGCEEMMSRLELLTLQPKQIWILDAYSDYAKKILQIKYPSAEIFTDAAAITTGQSIDLIFANLIPIGSFLVEQLQRFHAALRPNGVILISTFGPDTLKEFASIPDVQFGSQWIDMHDLGDLMIRSGFADPVLDMENIYLTYPTLSQLKEEMQLSGLIQFESDQLNLKKNPEGYFELTFEFVFAHAFGTPLKKEHGADEAGVVKVPLAHLRRKKTHD